MKNRKNLKKFVQVSKKAKKAWTLSKDWEVVPSKDWPRGKQLASGRKNRLVRFMDFMDLSYPYLKRLR